MGKATMKRAGVFNPYWATMGGGEKYCATVAECLLENGYEVDIFWNDHVLFKNLIDRFNIDISKARLATLTSDNILNKFLSQQKYDLIFWVSDGSVPLLFGRKNLLHFQVPFHNVKGDTLATKLKMTQIKHIICNSSFTKAIIDKEFRANSDILYPPSTLMTRGEKKNMILSVGRFDNLLHAKRQDILIESFKELQQDSWQLVLAGGSLSGSHELKRLEEQIGKDRNIQLIVNPSYKVLSRLYGEAKIYWHAAGYGSDLEKYPEKAEHFGISTVEAMSAGAVPVVFKGGGQTEIVISDQLGLLWTNQSQLVTLTNNLIHNSDLLSKMSDAAEKSAQRFSIRQFRYEFKKFLS